MPDAPHLSKTLFKAGRECPKRMWFDHHQPHLKPPKSEAERARFEEGSAVGRLAQGLYPGGVLAPYVGLTDEEAAARTRELIDGGAEIVYEATFVAEDRVVRCDVLRRHPKGGWIVDEVKASTTPDAKKAVQDGHAHDVAFQLATLRKCGIEVTEGGLVVLDKTYAWSGGEPRLQELFTRIDLTADCEKLREEIESEALRLGAHLTAPTMPEAEIGTHCKKCDYASVCLADVPKDDLIYLPFATRKLVEKLRASGYRTIRDLPEGVLTDRRMLPTHRVLTTGQPWICAGLRAELDRIEFPAAFIDFESCQPAVPTYPGTGPYAQVCFQWSAPLFPPADAEPAHREFLHADGSDPRPDFCRALWEAIRDAQTVVIYSTFETQRVAEMAKAGIPYAEDLRQKLDASAIDLEKVVRERVCLEEFKYRTSIKTVLPALVPTMSYADLAIADGSAAMTAFRRLIAPGTSVQDAETIRNDLRAYCRQDTLAMVEIYRALDRLANQAAAFS